VVGFEILLIIPDAIHWVLQSVIWQRLEIYGRKNFAIGVIFLSNSDDVAGDRAVDDLVVVPRSIIFFKLSRAITAQEIRNAVFVDVFNKRLKWLSTNNLNFLPCLLIKPTLYNFPNSGESPRCVDDAELAELLRIIILCNL